MGVLDPGLVPRDVRLNQEGYLFWMTAIYISGYFYFACLIQ